MKNLSLIFLFLLLSSCANEKKTFWCGDHACINKQERMQYFKENMTFFWDLTDKKVKSTIKCEIF